MFCVIIVKIINTLYQEMIKPLSLIPRIDLDEENYSPSHRKRADSLVFSITSQKQYSSKDTILLQSREEDVQKELESLQFKLCSLENKVQYITTDHLLTETHDRTLQNKIKEESRYSIDLDCISRGEKENSSRQINAGKIVKKDRSLSRSSKVVKAGKKSNVATYQSRNSNPDPALKTRELLKLRKAVNTMKQSIERTERSRSMCSQRLSASKSLIKSLKKQQRKNEKVVLKLRGELKKSQTIREKQKQIILRQQQEISHYRQLLKLSKPLR